MQKNSKSTLKEVGHTSSLLKCSMHTVTVFPKRMVWKQEGEKNNFTVEKAEKHHLYQVIAVNINSDSKS